MSRVKRLLGRERNDDQARLFMLCWEVIASADDELRFQCRHQTLTLDALKDIMDRAAPCATGPRTRFVFDLSGVVQMESCYSVICALFICFARRLGSRCRIAGLNARLAAIFAFFLRRVGCIELELASQAASGDADLDADAARSVAGQAALA